MGLLVNCYIRTLKIKENESSSDLIKRAMICNPKDLDRFFEYGVVLPEDMAETINDKGGIDRIDHKKGIVVIRFYSIDFDATKKLEASQFKFGD